MRCIILFLLSSLATANVVAVVDAYKKSFPFKRDIPSELASVKGGLLVKNNKQTSCELGLIDSSAGYVSANCVDFNSDPPNGVTKYEVILDSGIDGKTARHNVDSIYVHPQYNQETLANNIAIVQFNTKSEITWLNPIGVVRELFWEDLIYVRRSLKNLDTLEWNTPEYLSTTDSDDTLCSSMSLVYSHNKYDYACTHHTASMSSSSLSDCDVPYGTVYTHMNGKLYFVGFYSHTTASGGERQLCSHTNISSYYTLASDFVFFAASQTARRIDFYPANNTVYPNLDFRYKMHDPKSNILLDEINIIGGNLFKDSTSSDSSGNSSETTLQTEKPTSSKDNDKSDEATSSESITNIATNSGSIINIASQSGSGAAKTTIYLHIPTEAASTSETNKETDNEKEKSSSKTPIIAGICGVLGIILLVVGGIYFARFVRVYRQKRKVDPYSQTVMETILAEEMHQHDTSPTGLSNYRPNINNNSNDNFGSTRPNSYSSRTTMSEIFNRY